MGRPTEEWRPFFLEQPMVKLKATELDVFVDGRRVGSVTDCGDCWRAFLYGRLRRRGYNLPDYNTRAAAVHGIVSATGPKGAQYVRNLRDA